MDTSSVDRSTWETRLRSLALKALLLLLLFVNCKGVRVDIDYSFAVPKKFGLATLKSAKCCPYGVLPENFTDEFVAPSVYGIGVQKGGTTNLFAYLDTHPRLHSGGKEMHYFDRFNISETSFKNYLSRWGINREMRKSWRLEKHGDDEKLEIPEGGKLFEISPSYLLVPFAACRAKYFTPNAKFIILLREPAERTYSGINHAMHFNRNLPEESRPKWTRRTFPELVKEGIQLVKSDPICDFRSGRGTKTYNDCFQCVMMLGTQRSECDHQTFVKAIDKRLGFSCTKLSKNVILRGMYAAQIAWWFTLHPPSQFKIVNSEDFFKNSREVLSDIVNFLGFDQRDTEAMFEDDMKKKNKGKYNDSLALEAERAKITLREFYRRPNLELYRLLYETGHGDFTPFEAYLRKLDYVDCRAARNIDTELCAEASESNSEIQIHTNSTFIELGSGGGSNAMSVHVYRRTTRVHTVTPISKSEYTTHTIICAVVVLLSLYTLLYLRYLR
eukprot:g2821.t1